jgi:hypothetical protein
MKRLYQIALCLAISVLCAKAHASNCSIPPGATFSRIQAIVNACGSGNTAVFAPGSYAITKPLIVPCGVSLAGPQVAWSNPSKYTATLNSAVQGGPAIVFSGCATPASVQYLNCNGGLPSPDGGMCFYFPAGTSNMTFSYNHIFGNQANADDPHWYDSLVVFDGKADAPVSNSDVVAWNIFGNSTLGDCSNVMSNYKYPGLSGNGGLCNGLGIHNGMLDLRVENNIFQYEEQGMKVYERQGQCVNCVIAFNDFSNIHRIPFETQSDIGDAQPVSMYILYNSVHDQFATNFGAWGISAANGCKSGCVTRTSFNVLINNMNANKEGGYTPGAIEVWGSTGTGASYNLIQGFWANGIMTSSIGDFVYKNNTFCMGNGGDTVPTGKGGYFNMETSNALPFKPSAEGNTFAKTNTCPQTSVAPQIVPASTTFTGALKVTFTNPGANRDVNTGIWYTTDGSNPVPGSGTAKYIKNGESISIGVTTIVKAVGMWGAQNQPTAYPSGYGYVPSAVQSATYTASKN